MVAESVPARRHGFPIAMRRIVPWRRAPLSALLSGILLGGSLVLLPSPGAQAAPLSEYAETEQPAVEAAIEESDVVSITVAPSASVQLQPKQDLTLTVTITNPTTETVPVGTLELYLAEQALTTRSALNDWLRPEESGIPGDRILSQPTKEEVLAGNTATIDVTVPAASVGLGTANAWGARGIAATMTAGAVHAEGRGTFVWNPGETPAPVNLAVIMPITTPAGDTGLIAPAALETYTGPEGLLSRQLDGVIDREVAIAIDPMIIASIRILGSSAPASARDWLDRLAHATNEIFPLSYADADIALEGQAGAGELLAPISFDAAIDPALFEAPPAAPEESQTSATPATPSASGAPEPTSTPVPASPPADGTPPTTEELLAWDYTATDIGWPAAGMVSADDLAFFAANGLTTTILSAANVNAHSGTTPNTVLNLGKGRGLVTDDLLQSAIRSAALSTTDAAWRAAIAEAASALAVVAAEPGAPTEGADSARTLLATFDRGWPPTATRLSETLSALAALPWRAPATLESLGERAAGETGAFVPQAEPEGRVDLAQRLLEREEDVTAFSTALTDPLAVTGPYRLDMLALFATSWTADAAEWRNAVGENLASSEETLQSVSVTTRGPINVAANKVPFPITVSNALNQAVTLRVRVVPSNGRLIVGSGIDATIDPNSARTVTVPVTAAIGNGEVTLRVSLFTTTGVPVGRPALIAVNVQADWEGLGALILAIAVVLFFGFGVWRNIVRRRKDSGASASELEEPAESPEVTEPSGRPHG